MASLIVTLFDPAGPGTVPLLPENELFTGTCTRPLVPFEEGCDVLINAVELCNRVLTTSNGHVTTAPTVPAVLKRRIST